jgi:ABC-2 type transport system permease protein
MNSLYIALNLIKRLIGNKKGFLTFVILPTIVISAIIGLSGNSAQSAVTVAYVDADKSMLSEHIIHELQLHPNFQLKQVDSSDELKQLVINNKASAAVIIPAGFDQSIRNGGSPELTQYRLSLNADTFIFEEAVNQEIRMLAGVVASIPVGNEEQLASVLQEKEKHTIQSIKIEWRENANLYLSTIIGFMLMFMMLLIGSGVSTVMDDRKDQTMARVYASPVYSGHIAAGNFMGMMVLGTLQVGFIILFSRLLFGFNYGVSVWEQLIVMECFLLATMGIASSLAGFVRNTDQLGMLNSLVLTPTCMIGGCFWPIEYMPEFMQKMANFVPQKWAIEAMQRMAQGEQLSDVWMPIGILIMFGVVLLGFGMAVLKPTETRTS